MTDELLIKQREQFELHNKIIRIYAKILLLEEFNDYTIPNVRFYTLLYDEHHTKVLNGKRAIAQRNKCIRKLKRRYEGYKKEIDKISSEMKRLDEMELLRKRETKFVKMLRKIKKRCE